MSFKQYSLKPYIIKATEDLKFIQPTSIQEAIIPLVLDGKSVVGQAVTGSGKTHAFMLPIFERLEASTKQPQVIITSPTRELAKQLYDVAVHINQFKEEPYSIKLYVGGRDREKELKWLERNQPDIVIGTPGRIGDLALKEHKLLIHDTKILVIDEADMTLDSGFLEQIDQLAGTMPEKLQMCVFSATIPEKLQPFLKKYMANPEVINLTRDNPTPQRLTHYLLRTKHRSKENLLLKIMASINPYLAIIFTNTKKDASDLAAFLRSHDMKVGEVHGDLESRERARMMRDIRELRYTYIVATDIAARGIDIAGVSHIINFSLPIDYEFYIHRSGRTSRQNTTGMVISLYERDDNEYLNKLEAKQIHFSYIEIKENGIIDAKERNFRKKFVMGVKTNKQNPIKKPKPKQIKPNYKRNAKRSNDKVK